jgi:3-hydroxyacyl-CoA dehydrogenase
VHAADGSFSPAQRIAPRSTLPVYRRQPFPDPLLGESRTYGDTISKPMPCAAGHRRRHRDPEFKSRMHAIGEDVLDGVAAGARGSRAGWGLVIWQTEPPFSVGANLKKSPASVEARRSRLGSFFRNVRRVPNPSRSGPRGRSAWPIS